MGYLKIKHHVISFLSEIMTTGFSSVGVLQLLFHLLGASDKVGFLHEPEERHGEATRAGSRRQGYCTLRFPDASGQMTAMAYFVLDCPAVSRSFQG